MCDESRRIERQNARIEQVKREKKILRIAIASVIALVIVIALILGRKPKIHVVVNSMSITQGEKVPAFELDVRAKGNQDKVLDKSKDFTVKKFVSEIQSGKNCEIVCKADGETDGKFRMKFKFKDSVQKKFDQEWSKKIKFTVEDGTLTIKNKYGAWDGNKFKKKNGKYAKNEFIPFQGHKYYFNKKGEKVTGELVLGGKIYKFAKDGKLKSEKYYIDPEKPMIALTFDDGPGPETLKLLKQLEKYNARATFFMVGTQVPKYPEAVKKMKEIGCELGNHTIDHTALTTLTAEEINKTIQGVSDRVKDACGSPTTVTRPPYGKFNDHVKANAPEPLIMWSIDTLDWKTKNVESTIKEVNKATDGDIILMHDIHRTSIQAALKLIPQMVEKGYQFVTVSELAEARGVELENGGVYFSFYKGKNE